jgi:ABC-2 type transport system ATP-binding protein
MPEAPLIHVHDLSKQFRTFRRREGVWGALQDLFVREYLTVQAVDRITFEVAQGEMVGYIGPNGAGKSTTIKMLTGILVPTSGEVTVGGLVPWRDRTQYVRNIGVVFGQRTQLWWDIAVIESFQLLRKMYGVSPRDFDERMQLFGEILGIKNYLHTPVRKLSLGERMRCDLAAALLHNPPLLFLDEPTIGLDVVAKGHIRQFLRDVNQRFRTTVLLTTHDLDDIEALCRRIIIIDRGRLLYDGPLELLKQRLLRMKQVKFVLRDAEAALQLRKLAPQSGDGQAAQPGALGIDGLVLETVDELTYRVRFDRTRVSTADLVRQVLSQVDVRDLVIEDESIEDVVKRIYAGEALREVNLS